MNNAPIGVFDSGSGGLSILQSLKSMLPQESFVYFGDHAYSPYGGKTSARIRSRVVSIIKFLLSRHCKLIVVACNTATIAGIDYYREVYPDIPIVGVVPVVKTAAAISKTKHFIVLSTEYTAISTYQKNLICEWARDCVVTSIGSSKLVPLIEQGILEGNIITHELRSVFGRVRDSSFDVVVLGCTHYPFIRSTIQKVVGINVTIIDSSFAVARQTTRILIAKNDRSQGPSWVQFYSTGNATIVEAVFNTLLSKKILVTHVTV